GIKSVMKKTERGIERYETRLAVRLYNKLKNIPGVVLYTDSPEKHRCVPVISFNIEGLDSEEIAEILDKRYNIAVRSGLHCAPLAHEFFGTNDTGTVRAVLSVFSTCEQVDYFASSIRTINKFKKELKKVAIDI
ncbi:MAG: aminotransferase class V-fold PLP-dependent enzyme, partial [Ruminococcus sp.]